MGVHHSTAGTLVANNLVYPRGESAGGPPSIAICFGTGWIARQDGEAGTDFLPNPRVDFQPRFAGKYQLRPRTELDHPERFAAFRRVAGRQPAHDASRDRTGDLADDQRPVRSGDFFQANLQLLVFSAGGRTQRVGKSTRPIAQPDHRASQGRRFTWTLNTDRKMSMRTAGPWTNSSYISSIATTRPSAGAIISPGSSGGTRRGLRKNQKTSSAHARATRAIGQYHAASMPARSEKAAADQQQLRQTDPHERQTVAPLKRVVRRLPVVAALISVELDVTRVEHFVGTAVSRPLPRGSHPLDVAGHETS